MYATEFFVVVMPSFIIRTKVIKSIDTYFGSIEISAQYFSSKQWQILRGNIDTTCLHLISLCREEKGEKGHHDKEEDEGEYHEEKGHKKKHHDDKGYHHKAEKGEKGEKGKKYNEEGNVTLLKT